MNNLPNCPECDSEYTYQDGGNHVCPECGHEWSASDSEMDEQRPVVRDAVGNAVSYTHLTLPTKVNV